MSLLDPFRAIFAWQTVHETARHRYQENGVTGARRALITARGGYSPVDQGWLDGGEFGLRPLPPRGGTGVPRPSWREPVYPAADRCPTCGAPR